MFKTRAISLLAGASLLLGVVGASIASARPHDLDNIPYASSLTELTNYFREAKVPIEILRLTRFKEENFIVAAYPYSGLDTIDVYYFVKWGDGWHVKMLYYYLRPKRRHVRVEEADSKITLLCEKEELLTLNVDKTLNSPQR